jgi:RNA polymerase sigma factor (sigma-70 family)
VTDERLMQAVRDGDVAQLGLLFERHHAALFDFLSRMTGDRTAAEDLTQDVFVRMLKYRATFRDEGKFETWMFHIARNSRADYFRGRAAAAINDAAIDVVSHAPGPAHQLERDEETRLLRRALLQLRDDKRELLVLARYRGMKHEAIAELVGVDAGTVKVRIHRALKDLREIVLSLKGSDAWTARTPQRTLRII